MPESFTEVSRPLELHTSEHSGGVVLDTLDAVDAALRKFETGTLAGSEKPTEKLFDETVKEHGIMGLAVAMLGADANARNKPSLTSMIMEKARKAENDGSPRLFDGGFEYEALGTSFFKTSINITKCDEKYVLGINQAYVGNEVEAEVSTSMDTHAALYSAIVYVTYTNVDSLWFNIDLTPYAQIFETFNTTLEYNTLQPPPSFTYNGRIFEVSFKINSVGSNYDLKGGSDSHTRYTPLLVTKDMLMSGATEWGSRYYWDSADKQVTIPDGFVVAGQPVLRMEIRLPNNRNNSYGPIAVEQEDIDATIAARDALADKLKEILRI